MWPLVSWVTRRNILTIYELFKWTENAETKPRRKYRLFTAPKYACFSLHVRLPKIIMLCMSASLYVKQLYCSIISLHLNMTYWKLTVKMSPCFCFIRVRNLAASFPNSSAWPSQGIIPLSRGGSFLRLQNWYLMREYLKCVVLKFSSRWKCRLSYQKARQTGRTHLVRLPYTSITRIESPSRRRAVHIMTSVCLCSFALIYRS